MGGIDDQQVGRGHHGACGLLACDGLAQRDLPVDQRVAAHQQLVQRQHVERRRAEAPLDLQRRARLHLQRHGPLFEDMAVGAQHAGLQHQPFGHRRQPAQRGLGAWRMGRGLGQQLAVFVKQLQPPAGQRQAAPQRQVEMAAQCQLAREVQRDGGLRRRRPLQGAAGQVVPGGCRQSFALQTVALHLQRCSGAHGGGPGVVCHRQGAIRAAHHGQVSEQRGQRRGRQHHQRGVGPAPMTHEQQRTGQPHGPHHRRSSQRPRVGRRQQPANRHGGLRGVPCVNAWEKAVSIRSRACRRGTVSLMPLRSQARSGPRQGPQPSCTSCTAR